MKIETFCMDVEEVANPSNLGTYIVKLNVNGEFVWGGTIGGESGNNRPNDINFDPFGKVLITGTFGGTTDLDPTDAGTQMANSVGSDDIYVIKLNSDGSLFWAYSFGGSWGDYGNAIIGDDWGNVYVTGQFRQTVDFDPGTGTVVGTLSSNASGDFKVAGLLAEKTKSGVIVGVGINVSTTKAALPVDHATSIFLATDLQLDRNKLLAKILNNLEKDLSAWQSGADLTAKYRALSATIGSQVRIALPDGSSVEAVAVDIDETGSLHLDNGQLVTVGDVIHLDSKLSQ